MKTKLLARMNKISILFVLLLTVSFVNAATRTSTAAGGTWSAGGTWVGGVAPVAGDNVIIATTVGNSVTLGANATIVDVTVNAGATLNIANRTLTINGFFTNNGTTTGTSGQLNLSTGNFSNTGTITLSTGRIIATVGNLSNSGTITYSGAGRLYLGGDYTNSGTVTLLSSNVYITGTANQSIQGFTTTGAVNMLKTGGTATLNGNVTGGALTINGLGGTLSLVSGTHTFTSNWTRTNGTVDCGSSTLRINGSVSGTGGTFVAGTGTVEYYRNGNQTVAALTYNNLTLSGTTGTRVKTFDTTPTVNGKLTIAGTATVVVTTGVVTYGANATLQYDTTNVRTITSEEWITPFAASGGVVINGTNNITLNAAKVFGLSSPLTITSTGRLVTNNFGLTFGGNFVINNGGTFTAGSSPIVITNTAANQSIAGFTTTGLVSMTKTAGTATLGGNANGAGLTINGVGGTLNLGAALTHTFTGAVALTNGTLNGGSSTLNANFTGSAWTGTGTNFVRGTGTVNFGGAAQTLATASTFNNLTFSNSGAKTLTGVPTVNGILSMEGTATVSAAPTYGANATLQYNRTASQNAGAEWITPFAATGGVSVINTGVITANAIKVFNASVPLSIAAGATLSNGGFSISGGSTIAVANTGTLQIAGTSVFPVFTTTTLGTSSIVNYTGTAQTVAVKNYGNLFLSGSGNKTFVGATTIIEDLAISGTAVALFSNGSTSSSETLTLGGVLQTALGSWGGTASAATNQNATWFGASTTGILNVTTSCVAGTWLGTTNTDWNTAANWCAGVLPTALSDITIATATNQPTIGASGGLCRNITILSGATLTITGANVLDVSGNWTNNGTFTPNSSTINFNGTAVQTIGGTTATTFNNLTNSNTAAIVTATNGVTVNNSLNIANSAILDMATFVLTDGGALSDVGSGQIRTSSTSSTPIPTGKTWNSTVVYSNATGGQTIVAGTYNGTPSLELDNASGTQTASGAIVTGGQLNINNGGAPVFDMNGYNLTTNALNILDTNAVLDMRGATLAYTSVLAMDGKVRFSGATNGKPFASGIVEYYGATQTVTSGSYFKLLFTGVGGVYTMASDIDVASTLNVTDGAVTVQDGFTLSVDDAVTVVNPATLTIENNASLLQTTYTGANTGDVIVKRHTTPIAYFDYTYWSSPTTGTQTLFDFSPLTDPGRFHAYDSSNDTYTYEDATTTVFEKGRGYSILAPEDTPLTPTVNTAYQFVGVPNNGSFTMALTTPPSLTGFSLIGNPYPSALNADDFINENLYDAILNPTNTLEGTLYFWTHNNGLDGNDFDGDDYYYYNLSGGNGYGKTGTGNNTLPTEFIASGQGFFIENVIAGSLKFDNTMRVQNNNTNFYKTKKSNKVTALERHRIWLNFTDSTLKKGSQIMVGYIENATNNYEGGYDSYVFDEKPFLMYSLIGTEKMAIQGRELPFTDSDIVPLGYSLDVVDNVTIAIDHVDGLFLEDQEIYLEDKLLNVIHDIKDAPYTFASAAGTFDDRFVLRYTAGSLSNPDFNTLQNQILVSNKNKQIKINSFAETIDKISVYDLSGKLIYQKDNVNSNELSIIDLVSSRQTLIVKTTLQNGDTVTNKVIY